MLGSKNSMGVLRTNWGDKVRTPPFEFQFGFQSSIKVSGKIFLNYIHIEFPFSNLNSNFGELILGNRVSVTPIDC